MMLGNLSGSIARRLAPAVFLLALLFAVQCIAQTDLVERVGATGFIQLQAESFKALTPRQQLLGYWLSQAAIAVDPIIYDQMSSYGLRQKRILEEIVARRQGLLAEAKIESFTKLFWANRGNHNATTAQKILPDFTFAELQGASLRCWRAGGMRGSYAGLPPLHSQDDVVKEVTALRASLFDPDFEPMTTAKSPRAARDILQSSGNSFYSGVNLGDLKDFQEKYPLNSRLVKLPDGKLQEVVYRAGTPDGRIAPGLYAIFLKQAIFALQQAKEFAEPRQAQVIADLARYYQTGDPQDWLRFDASWVQSNDDVDFANGFIEVYRDARGAKGSSQSFVSVTDKRWNRLMLAIADKAQYFEDRAPWDPQYRKQGVHPPLAKAVETLIETGDFHVTTVGDNLPNENEIHEKYGSKSFLFTGSSRALSHAGGDVLLEEFAASPEEIELGKKQGDEAEDLLTGLHEIIGHGSGKMNPRLTRDPAFYLKEYYSTLEEGRADLMALWNAFDPKLAEMGLMSSPDVAKEMYNSAARAALTQLRRIPTGDSIEEDHERDRQLIVNYIMDKTGAIARIQRDGKTYMVVKDYIEMRRGVGMLLKELMRIKAEGDYPAIKALIDTYGIHFDPKLRDEVVARYQQLNLPSYWAGINPKLSLRPGKAGRAPKVEISYPRNTADQYLGYASMYRADVIPRRLISSDVRKAAAGTNQR